MTPARDLEFIHNSRLPGLTVPCRETDVLIGIAMGWRHRTMGKDMAAMHHGLGLSVGHMANEAERRTTALYHLPRWTEIIDDGIKLIPDGFYWSSFNRQGSDGACRVSLTGADCTVTRYAATPALAMVTAAIGARITGGRFDR